MILMLCFFSLFISCNGKTSNGTVPENCKSITVTASAYHSLEGELSITSWGDTLKPTINSVAVSPDLLEKGLCYGSKIKIEGLPGTYVVLDKMNRRWTNKIDIYMGDNRKKALEWGSRKVEICYLPSAAETEN